MEYTDLLINIAIALGSITLGIYAIANSMILGQLRRNMRYAEVRVNETSAEVERAITQGASKEVLAEIRKRIEEYEIEKEDYDLKLTCLKLEGAVLYPCLGYGSTVIIYALNDYLISSFSNWSFILTNFIMTIGVIWGTYRLYLVLSAIEYAALNIPLPEFDINFSNSKKRIESRAGERTICEIKVHNKGYLVGELVEISIFFPESVIVHEKEEYTINKQDEDGDPPNNTSVHFYPETIHVDVELGFEVEITAPDQVGVYKIPVYVDEKHSTQTDITLELDVIAG